VGSRAEASISEEPGAVVPHAGIRAGGGRVTALSTATAARSTKDRKNMATQGSSLLRMKHYTKLISPFSKKMSVVAGGTILCGMVICAPFVWLSLPWRLGINLMYVLTSVVGFIVWSYLAVMLLWFYLRTQLREYILYSHTFWLAGVIAFPLVYFFRLILRFSPIDHQSKLYTSLFFVAAVTWLVLGLIGKILSKNRSQRMITEIQRNAVIWKQLLSLNLMHILFLQFPKASNWRI
jgi:cation transport ATPase